MAFLNKAGLERLWAHILLKLNRKVDKVEGKGLSTEDFTTEEKNNLKNLTDTCVTKDYVDSKVLDNIPVPVNASVGQIIVVKAVDENGRPTEWEAVDRVIVDDTLTISGAAADAQATNEAINKPKENITFIDQVNGYQYIACMRDGSLVTYCATQSIEVAVYPTKTEYLVGDTFEPDGMKIMATAYDGITKEITDYSCIPEIINENTTYVSIAYTEGDIIHEAIIPITIKTVAESLIDFNYKTNSNGTYTITGWKGTLNGEPSTEMIIPNSNLIIV